MSLSFPSILKFFFGGGQGLFDRSTFKVQEGAASGKTGRQKSQHGVDDQARAGALGVLGLRLLRHTLQGTKKGVEAQNGHKNLEEIVPAVVSCSSAE